MTPQSGPATGPLVPLRFPARASLRARRSTARLGLFVLVWGTAVCHGASAPPAAAPPATEPADLADLSLEELMDLSVTSVSKKETKLNESAAAITVITQEDIRRSGMTSLPELLRMVPGVEVARIHGNEWAVSARGFNDQYANKLLVLIDGRSVYSPMFAGVYWNAQDLVLEDIDRIEVIRGPGAALWGANAVNGVINITTKSAAETQGGLLVTSFGSEERPTISLRYGGQLAPKLHYRFYAKYFDREGFDDQPGERQADRWNMARAGGRLDSEPSERDRLTVQGDYYRGTVGEHFNSVSLTPPLVTSDNLTHHNFGGNVLGRWTRTLGPASELQVQAYFDRFQHGDGDIAETRNTFDLDLQHRFPVGSRQDVVWGLGFRDTRDRLSPTFYLTFDPERDREQLYSAFLQDEVTLLAERLKLTLGSKLEHNKTLGFKVQPSVQLLWTPTGRQTAWTSVSHAIRTPSRFDRNSRLNAGVSPTSSGLPFLVALLGNPTLTAEKVTAYQLGYRVTAKRRLSLDLVAFYNVHDGILAYVAGPVQFEQEPAPPHLLLPLTIQNSQSGESYGTEIALQWRVSDSWKLIVGQSLIHLNLHPNRSENERGPQQQLQLRSYLDLSHDLRATGAVYYVDSFVTTLDNTDLKVPSYVRLDLGLSWQALDSLEVGIWGQNLLDGRHPEFGSFKTGTFTEVPRGLVAKIAWHV